MWSTLHIFTSAASSIRLHLSVTNRRVNALENVTIPRIQGTLDYIARELDELEREGEFALKLDVMFKPREIFSSHRAIYDIMNFVFATSILSFPLSRLYSSKAC